MRHFLLNDEKKPLRAAQGIGLELYGWGSGRHRGLHRELPTSKVQRLRKVAPHSV